MKKLTRISNWIFGKPSELSIALKHPLWKKHVPNTVYTMINVNGSFDEGWKIAYYPLFGTYKLNKWQEFKGEPRALIEKQTEKGIDFREVPLRYLKKTI